MKNWMTRFATLAAVVAVMGSALMVGCSGSGDADDAGTGTTNNTTAPAAETDD